MSLPTSPPLPLVGRADRDSARRLVEGCDLRFLEDFDDLLGVFEGGRLVACGARAGRVLEMLVVSPDRRGGGLVGEVVGELMRRGCEAGCAGFFIFTRPCAAPAFARLGFKPLVEHGKAVLMEHGNALLGYLRGRAALARSGENAAVVVNADPFTLGHRYLVERAAGLGDTVYVLVPGEGRFALPLAERLELARLGTAHVPNAVVLDAGPYALGAGALPAYFLRPEDRPEQVELEIDADLFGRHLAPFLGVATRVVGTEPLDPATRGHNQALARRLTRWGQRLVEVERMKVGDRWVSTAHVRGALARGDWREVEAFVPPSTLAFLKALEPGAAAWRTAA